MKAPRMGKKRDYINIWCMPSQPKEDITVGVGIRQCLQLVADIKECSTFDQWLCWSTLVSHHRGQMELKQHLRMSLSSVDKLLSFIRTSLEVDSAMAQL